MSDSSQTLTPNDRLTGALTRENFLPLLTAQLEDGGEHALALLDIDHFKRFNDEHGEALGDAHLARTAEVIRRNLRPEDVFCRFGGEEFAILLPDTPLEAAFVMLEDLRRTLAEREYVLSAGEREAKVSIRFSGGIAGTARDGRTDQELLRAADEALYQAKVAGRNRINLAISRKMKMKSSYYTTTQLERLAQLAQSTDRSEAYLLREALDDLLRRYDGQARRQ